MEVDRAFLLFLQKEEGFRRSAYPDSNGVPTIGIGHKLLRSEKFSGKIIIDGVSVRYTSGLTNEQVHALCRQDTKRASDCVNKYVKVPLSQKQFNILVEFTFNVGTEAFKDSTLLKKLNARLYSEIPKQLQRWTFDDGVFVPALADRRQREVAVWMSSLRDTADEEEGLA